MENVKLVTEIFKGERKDSRYDIICLNAGAMLYLYGITQNIQDGILMAQNTIQDGKVDAALKKLQNTLSVIH